MNISIFWARLLGLYLLVLSAVWLFCKEPLEAMVRDVATMPALLASGGAFAILYHNSVINFSSSTMWQRDRQYDVAKG